jgi:ribosomal protein S25
MPPRPIGTRNETSLHRDLKFSYAGENGRTEAEIDGFVADGISADGEFIEVQTTNFALLREKVQKLTMRGQLRIVYPAIITKYLEVFNADGKRQYRRKSNRQGSPWDLFNALVRAPDLPLIPRVVIELVLVDASEQRVQDGKGSWRRKGVSIRDRQLITVHERICLEKRSDYRRFVPFKKNEEFTSTNLAEMTGISQMLARRTLYVLTKMGIVSRIGKQRNAFIYRLARLNNKKNAPPQKIVKITT